MCSMLHSWRIMAGQRKRRKIYSSSLNWPKLIITEGMRWRSSLIRRNMATSKIWLWPLQNADNLHLNPMSDSIRVLASCHPVCCSKSPHIMPILSKKNHSKRYSLEQTKYGITLLNSLSWRNKIYPSAYHLH